MQDLGTARHGGVEEGLHGYAIGRGEGDVGLPETVTRGLLADPAVWVRRYA